MDMDTLVAYAAAGKGMRPSEAPATRRGECHFVEIYQSSPAIRQFYAQNRDWYDPKIRELFDPLAETAGAGEADRDGA